MNDIDNFLWVRCLYSYVSSVSCSVYRKRTVPNIVTFQSSLERCTTIEPIPNSIKCLALWSMLPQNSKNQASSSACHICLLALHLPRSKQAQTQTPIILAHDWCGIREDFPPTQLIWRHLHLRRKPAILPHEALLTTHGRPALML